MPIFVDDWDRFALLDGIADGVKKDGWLCYAYCLMTNHYHCIVETPKPNLPAAMERLNGNYARRFNRRHGRRNHLFGERYHDELVMRDAHLLEASRYVVLNPVRAGLRRDPAAWPWSSYAATAGRSAAPPFLARRRLLAHFGGPDAIASARYAAFVADGMADPAPPRFLAPGHVGPGHGPGRRSVPTGRELRSPGTSATRRLP
jgi:putative transposase